MQSLFVVYYAYYNTQTTVFACISFQDKQNKIYMKTSKIRHQENVCKKIGKLLWKNCHQTLPKAV